MKKITSFLLNKINNSIKSINPFKSQYGQDAWVILEIMKFKRKGYFIDLAAADGVTNSNTYVLEKWFGWEGICIEPNPQYFEKLAKLRKCVIETTAISERHEKVSFRIDNGQHGGIVSDDTKNKLSKFRGKPITIITLDAKPLSDILIKHNAPMVIDYLSLDIEGAEDRVIRSIDFSKYTIKCMTIENPSMETNKILLEAGYWSVKEQNGDGFFIHQSLKK